MHADATSEKYAMGWHLNGRVSAVVGSHSHVQTADEQILPGGTAYITDVGMTGAFGSVIGMKPEEVIRRFMTKRRIMVQQSKDNPGVSFVVITINDHHKATKIERHRYAVTGLDVDEGELD
jgi:calcineurin-like phosphoesterase